jgi:hypothetical protein
MGGTPSRRRSRAESPLAAARSNGLDLQGPSIRLGQRPGVKAGRKVDHYGRLKTFQPALTPVAAGRQVVRAAPSPPSNLGLRARSRSQRVRFAGARAS